MPTNRYKSILPTCLACVFVATPGCHAEEQAGTQMETATLSSLAKPCVEKTPSGVSLVYLSGEQFLMGRIKEYRNISRFIR